MATAQEKASAIYYHGYLARHHYAKVLKRDYDKRTLQNAAYHLHAAGELDQLNALLVDPNVFLGLFSFSLYFIFLFFFFVFFSYYYFLVVLFDSELRGDLLQYWKSIFTARATEEVDGKQKAGKGKTKQKESKTNKISDSDREFAISQAVERQAMALDEQYKKSMREFVCEDNKQEANIFSLLGNLFMLDADEASGYSTHSTHLPQKAREKKE